MKNTAPAMMPELSFWSSSIPCFDQNKYMMTAGNSPLENPKLSWDDMTKGKSLLRLLNKERSASKN